MSKKFLPVMLVLLGASFFIAFQTKGRGEDDPKSKNEKILHNIGAVLEQGHYSPQVIDDNFSKKILKKFETDLDEDKSIFLQSDIDSFKRYETVIDDEIHGTASLESFYTITDIYTKRVEEAAKFYPEILSKPFDFTVDENIVLDGDKLTYPKTDDERKDVWRKRLKYLVLTRYSDMLDDRDKNKGKKDFVFKADTTLQREATDQVRKQIDRYFSTLKNHNTSDELFSMFINTITYLMDPHTDYFPPIDARSFNESMSGSFFGIGAQLKEDDSKIKIASLITGGPAWKSGELKVGDEILKVGQGKSEPVDVTGYAVSDAVKLIRGEQKGSEVRLTIRRVDGTIKVVPIQRDQIKLDEEFAKSAVIVNDGHKLGYIYLPIFYVDIEKPNGAKCSQDVAMEVEKLKAENVEGIIIDLRENGGGSLQEVVKMVGLFIPDGPVCQVKARDERPFEYKDPDKSILYTGPLTVMVDENSASASEIFAAAIQDYKRGLIVGSSSTYGKGTVQREIPLNPDADNNIFANSKTEDLGTIKLTFEKFYRISGGATQLKGVTPDVVIPDRLEYLKEREKDNPSALGWDEIPKADYTPWVTTYSSDMVSKTAEDEINNNKNFNEIKKDAEWLDKENDKEYSLNIDKFRADSKEVKDIYKEMDSASRLQKELNVKNIATDVATYTSDKEKTDKNTQFLGRIKTDIYIDETVKVMNNMIGQSNVAKTN